MLLTNISVSSVKSLLVHDEKELEQLQKEPSITDEASKFIKEFVEVFLIKYSNLIQEIEEGTYKLKKKASKDNDDGLNKPQESKLAKNIKANQEKLTQFEPHFYAMFETLAQVFKEFMTQITEQSTEKLTDATSVHKYCEKTSTRLLAMSNDKHSILYQVKLMTSVF